ncbi:MAG TPA: cytoplasmic protein [Thermoplasmata archaeon]|jgi:beta-alanine degradation protein BauB|nr:MAG TPA: cytoplasmic protein [Thermoplasmata archaeon]
MEQMYDALHAAPNVYKLLMENDRVRVFDARFKPGEKAAMHTHPDHIVYVFNDGKLKLSPSKGKTQEMDLKAGQTIWMDAASHAAENLGRTDAHLLVVELKE